MSYQEMMIEELKGKKVKYVAEKNGKMIAQVFEHLFQSYMNGTLNGDQFFGEKVMKGFVGLWSYTTTMEIENPDNGITFKKVLA
jgi:hypothetical protein